jgi:type 1 glutamine amidotransferase
MKMNRLEVLLIAFALFVIGATNSFAADQKKIVLVAGPPSHGPGEHEFRAGCLLLKSCLDKVPGMDAVVYTNGWPKNADAFDGADAIVLYMDGGANHPALQGDHLAQLDAAMKRGVGLGCIHYAVEVPKEKGGAEWLKWTGGYFEAYWSVNPTWVADFKTLPEHPVTRGVKPFSIKDEWYYHMRFQPDHVTPLFSAVPPDSTREHPDDAHGGNQFVRERKGMSEDVAWVYDRTDGGRGFGFTGAHYHTNWANDDFRKLVLNAIVWSAKGDIPQDGIQSTVTPEELKENLDPKGRKRKINLVPSAAAPASPTVKAN